MIVSIYWNRHKKLWSVTYKRKVLFHTPAIYLTDCTFTVNKTARKKVLQEKRRNVHAFVRGEISLPFALDKTKQIRYNPYHCGDFVILGANTPIKSANKVYLSKEGKAFAK